ncbi:MAG: hypothetical protein KAT70_04565, partial [Thermoplasmata archaeon]|nr:hypothetical protein [Thermoplasmata archaeon]
DAGTRTVEDAADITVAGAARVVSGTKSLREWEDVEKMTDVLENLVLSIDVADDIVAPFLQRPSLDTILEEATTLSLAGGLLMDIKGVWSTPRNLQEMAESFKEFYFSVPRDIERARFLDWEGSERVGAIVDLQDALEEIGGSPWNP